MFGAGGRDPHRLVLVGAGAAGTMVAVQVAEESVRRGVPVEVTLVDPSPRSRVGPAFATRDLRHLLNLRAGDMSCLPDRPGHFVEWLVRHRDPTAGERSFVPRGPYGDYLAATLAASVERAGALLTLRRSRTRATECLWEGDRARVRLDDGSLLTAHSVVVATGPLAGTARWAPRELRASQRFLADPWAPDALAGPLADRDDVLLVGSGLTAVDVALTLDRPGRTIHALSRHGLLPQPHALTPLPPVSPQPLDGLPLHRLRSGVLRHIQRVVREQGDWRPALDGLRPVTARLWSALGEAERAEFLRNDGHVWNVHRYRMAPETAEAITRLRTARRLRLHVGEVIAPRAEGESITVTVPGTRPLRVGWVVDCSGPGLRTAESRDPFLTCLLSSGLAVPGPLGIGLATTADGRLRSRDGHVRSLWTLGAHRRGELWESTAVPEIRQQASDLTRSLLGSGRRDARST